MSKVASQTPCQSKSKKAAGSWGVPWRRAGRSGRRAPSHARAPWRWHPLVEQVGKDRALGLHVVPGRRYVGDLDAELSDVEGGLPNALPEQIEESRRFLGRDDDDSHVPSCRSDKVSAHMSRGARFSVPLPASAGRTAMY